MERKPYPSDVSDDEWALVAPYVTLMTEDAPQREHRLREVCNGLRRLAETLAGWHFVAFTILLLKRFVALMVQSA
jgi:transposase